MSIQELENLKEQLQNFMAQDKFDDAVGILKKLGSPRITEIINSEVVKNTKIGKIVGKLRKHKNNQVSEISKELVEKWKKLVSSDNQPAPPQPTVVNVKQEKRKNDERENQEASIEKKQKVETPKQKTNNKPKEDARVKIVKLLEEALKTELEEGMMNPSELANLIEDELHKNCKGVDKDYKQKFRSLHFNLKKNTVLRDSILKGMITPERFCKMTPHEMASDELKKEIKKFEEYHFERAKVHPVGQTTTDMFKCGKCGKRETTYHQLQTRSADEPMTTFHTCLNCGNRWRS